MTPQSANSTVIEVGSDYPVTVGHQVLDAVVAALPTGATRALIVHQKAVGAVADDVRARVERAGLSVELALVPDGEAAKTAEVAAGLWSQLAVAGFTRSDVVIGVGGGAVTDLAGFVAASWLRGVGVIQVPTTVLGMVDAAVGGKTGINIAEGKNLVGAFHPPLAVVADLDTLSSLPLPDVAAGLAECIKCGFIRDGAILDIVSAHPGAVLDVTSDELREVIERAIRVKAEVVAADLKESSLREILNYGHTFAHAIEQRENYTWRHGDAVAVGCVFAAELACAAGLLSGDKVEAHRVALMAVGLPTTYSGGDFDEMLTVMGRDKKTRGNTLRFVALRDFGDVTRLEGPTREQLRATFDAVQP